MKVNKEGSGIYIIINIITQKIYIGSASFLYKRKGNHFDSLRDGKHKNKHLQDSYNIYSKENFLWFILERCEKEILIEREGDIFDKLS